MTKEEMDHNVENVLVLVAGMLKKKINHLVNCGALDIEDEQSESYRTAKVVVYVALRETADAIRPMHGEAKEMAENLEHF